MKKLNEHIYVTGQIKSGDFPALIEAGIKTIINNRPDGEEMGQPLTADLAAEAKTHGINYFEIPIAGGFSPEQVQSFADVLLNQDTPMLAFCRTGTRSSLLWALSQAADGDIDAILETTGNAGYDFRGYRSMLESMKG